MVLSKGMSGFSSIVQDLSDLEAGGTLARCVCVYICEGFPNIRGLIFRSFFLSTHAMGGRGTNFLFLILGISVGISQDDVDDVLVETLPVLLRPHEPVDQGGELDEGVDGQRVIHARGSDG